MGMTCYIAHTYVVSDGDSAYYELGFDNEMRPNIVITESFIDDFAEPSTRGNLINDAFDANYTWREGDQYSFYSSDPWEEERPHTIADEIENTWGEEKREFEKFSRTVEKMLNIKYVLLATDATKPSDNYGEFWYDVLVCDFLKKNLIKIEWRGARDTYWETHYGFNMFNEKKAKEIIALLDKDAIDQIDVGDFALGGDLQGQVEEFPIIGSSKVTNYNRCIHILPKQAKKEKEIITPETEPDAVDSLNKEPMKSITMKDAFTHVATGIAAGQEHIVGLRADGTVVASMIAEDDFVEINRGQIDVSDWKDIVMISTAAAHTVGLKSDGTVVSTSITEEGWDYGQTAVDDWKDIIMVSAGREHTVGLRSDGTVVSTSIANKDMDHGQTAVEDWRDIVMISAGNYHTVGLRSDGTVVSTSIVNAGDWDEGQTAVDDWENIVMISAGDYHTAGLKSDGTVVAVGENEYYQTEVDDWTDIVAISAGASHTVGLKSDGTVVGVGGDPVYADDLQELSDWENITSVAAGYNYNLGFGLNGSIVFAPMDSSSDIDEDLIDFEDWEDIVNPVYHSTYE